MAEIYLSLNEVAELEGVPYKTIQQRVNRNPENYQLKKEQRECGGKDLSMIALSSLSKKAVTAYKERQKLAEVPAVPGMEEVAVSGESEVPWYVNEDVDYFMEQHKTEWYTAMELGNIVREFLNYDSAGRTEFAEYFAQERLGKGKRTLYRYAKSYLEASAFQSAVSVPETEGSRDISKFHPRSEEDHTKYLVQSRLCAESGDKRDAVYKASGSCVCQWMG